MQLLLIVLIVACLGVLTSANSFAKQLAESTKSVTAKMLRPLLNSERIRLKFGSYGIEVLKQAGSLRVSNLFSKSDDVKTTRTLAVVSYPEQIPKALAKSHQLIGWWQIHGRDLQTQRAGRLKSNTATLAISQNLPILPRSINVWVMSLLSLWLSTFISLWSASRVNPTNMLKSLKSIIRTT